MARSCVRTNGRTRKEENSILAPLYRSLIKRPENWSELEDNHRLRHLPTGCKLEISEQGGIYVYDRHHDALVLTTAFFPWSLRGRIWRHVHRLRHLTIDPQVAQFLKEFNDPIPDPQKPLPTEVLDAVRVRARETEDA